MTLVAPWLLYGALFLAVLLAVEAAGLYLRDVRGAKKRVNKRMTLMESGATTDEVLSQLRRNVAHTDRTGISARLMSYLERKLSQAGYLLPARDLLFYMLAATISIAFAVPIATGLTGGFKLDGSLMMVLVVAVSLGIGVPLTWLNIKATRRIKKFEQQFPIALDIFVRGLRAGHPVPSALGLLTSEMADPMGSEFGIVIDEVNYGLDLRDALENLSARVQTPDIQMFIVCVSIQAETGGNLAEILEGLSRVIRDRASMVLKVRALASEGKMSGIMLSILPVFTFVTTFLSTPKFYTDAVSDPIFMPGAIGLGIVWLSGVMIIRRLIDLKV